MEYDSYVILGEKCRDEKTGTEGNAVGSSVYLYGCERVTLEWKEEGEGMHSWGFDGPRLSNNPRASVQQSNIVLGEKYEDTITKIKGVATVLTFHESAEANVTLEYQDLNGELQELYLDVGRVKPATPEGIAAAQTEKQEEKTGGPMRGNSHKRPGPTRR
jgi:hypothetical protein